MRDDDGDMVGDSKGYLTARSKGKRYIPEETDDRDLGARNRSFRSQYSDQTGRASRKNIYKGEQDLTRLGRGVVTEALEEEEKIILEVNRDIKDLIENMEKRKNENKNEA